MILEQIIDRIYDYPSDRLDLAAARDVIKQLKTSLNDGTIRAAEYYAGKWRINAWVKKGILLGFKIGVLKEYSGDGTFSFFDKDTMSLRKLSLNHEARIVPGGTAVRDGAYLGKGVIVMPPAYINIGAYVDEGTMIDSHALVGSCAQIGKRVHISAGAQIGGVLEPIGAMPVIIEDDVMVGGSCGVYEGILVRRRAVLAAGVILTGSTPVYDIVKKIIHRRSETTPLIIPENAVVVPGARALKDEWGASQQLSAYTPVIIKYRDERTDAATVLEDSLR